MKKVFVLIFNYMTDDEDIEGIYSTAEKVNKALKQHLEKYPFNRQWCIEEWEVDGEQVSWVTAKARGYS